MLRNKHMVFYVTQWVVICYYLWELSYSLTQHNVPSSPFSCLPSRRIRHFSKDSWFPFSGYWCLEAKIWVLDMLIATGVSLFWLYFQSNIRGVILIFSLSHMWFPSQAVKSLALIFLSLYTYLTQLLMYNQSPITAATCSLASALLILLGLWTHVSATSPSGCFHPAWTLKPNIALV